MISRRIQETAISLILLGIFVGAIVIAQDYGPRSRMVPVILCSIGVILVLAQMIVFNLRKGAPVGVDLLEVISARATGDDEALPEELRSVMAKDNKSGAAEAKRPAVEAKALGVMLLGVGMFALFGPVVTMFAYTFGYFVISDHCALPRAAAYSALFTALVYGLFYVWLRVDLDVGVFNPMSAFL